MLDPLAAMWVPTALGVAAAGAILGLVVWIQVFRAGRDGDGPDSDSDSGGGGGGGKRPPRRPPPAGPVSWQDFERQFAAYVERRAGDERLASPVRLARRGD